MIAVTIVRRVAVAACVAAAVGFVALSVWFGARAPVGLPVSTTAGPVGASQSAGAEPSSLGLSPAEDTDSNGRDLGLPAETAERAEALKAQRKEAFASYGRGEFAAAADAFKTFLAARPQDAEAASAYAQSLWQLGEADAAAAQLAAILASSPNDPIALYQLALVERGRGNAQSAVTLLERALSTEGADPSWRVELARTLMMAGETVSARMAWKAVLNSLPTADPLRPGVLYEYGLASVALADMAEARAAFEEGARLQPENPAFASQLAALDPAAGGPATP